MEQTFHRLGMSALQQGIVSEIQQIEGCSETEALKIARRIVTGTDRTPDDENLAAEVLSRFWFMES